MSNVPEAPRAPPIRLGDKLVKLGLITTDQLSIALQEQKNTGKPLGESLLALGFVTEERLRNALADNLGEQAISLQGIVADPRAIALVPKALAKRHTLFPVSLNTQDNELLIASGNPNDIVASDQINALFPKGPRPVWRLASSSEVLSAIEQFYGHELSIDGILQELESGTIDMASPCLPVPPFAAHQTSTSSPKRNFCAFDIVSMGFCARCARCICATGLPWWSASR